MKGLRALILVGLALLVAAPTAVWGQAADSVVPMLNDSEEPGSVIVFHKFLTGTVDSGDGTQLPRSDFEISVTCPPGVSEITCQLIKNDPLIAAGALFSTGLTIHFHWVCPGTGPALPFGGICNETDFKVKTTIFGTVHINPENLDPKTDIVNPPPCPEGYLIGWVEDDLGLPTSWNGLIGDAVLRPSAVTELWAYNAVPIQAIPGATTPVPPADGTLVFDGIKSYKAVTGKIFGSVRYEDSNTQTFLTLLTLDVNSSRFNSATNVSLEFYNEGEKLFSTATAFTCWEEVELISLDTGLTTGFGTKGLVRSTVVSPQRTVLGIIDTHEVIPNSSSGADPLFRGYAYSLYNDSVAVPTTFYPNDQPPTPVGMEAPITSPLASATTTSTVAPVASTVPALTSTVPAVASVLP